MIQKQEQFTIETDESIVSAKFSLKEENLAHVFNILRNNLYSDKILAVVREYSTNAYDAHVDNNKSNEPIYVTLPTFIEPTFQVRDFGKGLSEYDVFNIFSSYGASTKRNTNELIGTLGMGSKSGFAYTNSFTITSWNDGTKKTYEAFIDETNIGTIAKVGEENSNEPTGLAITISVKNKDIYEFQKKAEDFYCWFLPTPIFYGQNIYKTVTANKFYDMDVIYNSDSCSLYKTKNYRNDTNIYIHMGNTCYKIANFDGLDVDWIRNHSLVIKVKLGEVTFTTSRESLEMNTLTLNTINRYMKEIQDSFIDECQKEINSCLSPYDALCCYHTMNDLKKKSFSNINWNGTPINIEIIKSLNYTTYNESRRLWKQSSTKPWFFKNSSALIINDGGFVKSQTSARLIEARKNLIANGKQNIFYVKESVECSKDMLKLAEFDGLDYVLLSDIAPNIFKGRSVNGFKNSEKFFKWKGIKHFPFSNCWESVTPDTNKKAIYVIIDSFIPLIETMNANSSTRWNFLSILQSHLRDNLGIQDFELYGVKVSQKSKIPSNWVSLNNYIKQLIKDILDNQDYQDQYINDKVLTNISTNWFTKNVFDKTFEPYVDQIECPKMQEVLKIFDTNKSNTYKNTYKSKIDFVFFIKKYINIDDIFNDFQTKANSNVQVKIKDMSESITYCVENYPLLNGFDQSYYTRLNPTTTQHLVNYVNTFHRATKNGW